METTGINNKRIAKNTLMLYFRMILTMAVSLYTSRVVLASLGVQDYGLYNVVGGVVTAFSFLKTSLAGAISRYLNVTMGKGDKLQLRKVFSMGLQVQYALSLIIVLIAETIGLWFLNTHMNIPENRMVAANWVYQFSLLSVVISMISQPYTADIIAHERMSAFAYISIYDVCMQLAVVYFLSISPFDKLIFYAFLVVLVQFSVRIIYSIYCKRNFPETYYMFVKEKELFKEMTSFAGWNLFGTLASLGATQGINILLNIFFGPSVNAARAVAVKAQHVVQGFVQNFQMSVNPQITQNYARGNVNDVFMLIYRSSRFSFYLMLMIAIPLILEADYVLALWLKKVPDHSATFLRIVMLVSLNLTLTNPLVVANNAVGNIKRYQMTVGGFLLLIVPITYVVLKLGGTPEDAFLVHLTISVLGLFVRLILTRRRLGLSILDYSKNVFLRIIPVAAFSLLLPCWIYFSTEVTIWSVLSVILVSVLSVSVASFFLGLTKRERDFFVKKLSAVIK